MERFAESNLSEVVTLMAEPALGNGGRDLRDRGRHLVFHGFLGQSSEVEPKQPNQKTRRKLMEEPHPYPP
jgi:hypothetical protein